MITNILYSHTTFRNNLTKSIQDCSKRYYKLGDCTENIFGDTMKVQKNLLYEQACIGFGLMDDALNPEKGWFNAFKRFVISSVIESFLQKQKRQQIPKLFQLIREEQMHFPKLSPQDLYSHLATLAENSQNSEAENSQNSEDKNRLSVIFLFSKKEFSLFFHIDNQTKTLLENQAKSSFFTRFSSLVSSAENTLKNRCKIVDTDNPTQRLFKKEIYREVFPQGRLLAISPSLKVRGAIDHLKLSSTEDSRKHAQKQIEIVQKELTGLLSMPQKEEELRAHLQQITAKDAYDFYAKHYPEEIEVVAGDEAVVKNNAAALRAHIRNAFQGKENAQKKMQFAALATYQSAISTIRRDVEYEFLQKGFKCHTHTKIELKAQDDEQNDIIKMQHTIELYQPVERIEGAFRAAKTVLNVVFHLDKPSTAQINGAKLTPKISYSFS